MACRGVMRGGRGLRSRFSILNYATMTGHLLYLFGCGWKPRYELIPQRGVSKIIGANPGDGYL
jgi:hypothetical protein